jgi:arginyl-tRNA synthetase
MSDGGAPGPTEGPTDPWAPLRARVLEEVELELAHRGAPLEPGWLLSQIEAPALPPADLALALHRPAKALGVRPDQLAQELAAEIASLPGFVRIAATGAYLNFFADGPALSEATLSLVLSRGDRYGWGPAQAPTVSVEHTSANTTGPFHIGRVRNAVIGDTLARILRAAGFPVTTQYYVDDVGRQAAILTWIWGQPVSAWPPELAHTLPDPSGRAPAGEKEDHFLGRPYPAASGFLKAHPEAAAAVQQLTQQLESGTTPAGHRELAERILRGMLASLARLDIRYDEFVWESSLLHDGSVSQVLELLAKAPHRAVEENGAEAIDASGYGLPKESQRIIVRRSDGTSLYVTRDVAFHLQKFARFDRVVDVLGADHLLHARTLEALLEEIGVPRRPEFVLYAYITAPGGGKMSTRAGTAVYLDDLLDEAVARAREEVTKRRDDLSESDVGAIAEKVGAGAIRYSILRVAPEKTVQFRWEEALSFEGRSAPFLQYSYARASSLLRKAERTDPPYPFRVGELTTPWEEALIRVLARLPGTVTYAARTAHVHTLATYAHDLAEAFNRFYNEVPVLRAEAGRESRLALVAAGRQALGNTLDLLGLARLERM